VNEQQIAAMRQALNKAFQLGQRYWSWSDSEYSSHWKKADAAKAEFDKLIEDTLYPTPPAAPVQEPVNLHQVLTDPENQPNQYGVNFGMYGKKMMFKIGGQQFALDYEPDIESEFNFMRDMLIHAFSTFTHGVKNTPPAQEFVCSTGLCHFTLTQTNVGIGERGMEAYEAAKERGWVGVSDERLMEMPKREWVGLTDEEIKAVIAQVSQIPPIDYTTTTYAKAIEAKLKEKNI
jgi:hypothetical protein